MSSAPAPDDGLAGREVPDLVTDPSTPDSRLRELDSPVPFVRVPDKVAPFDEGVCEWVIDQAAIGGSASGVTATGLS